MFCGNKDIYGSWVISLTFVFFSLFLFCSFFFFFLSLYFIILDFSLFVEYELFSLNSSLINFSLYFDFISLIFIRFVFFISSIVVFYREDYIHGDLILNRFILLVVLFVLSIIIIILSPNIIRILLGWDGLGLVSYSLVIYYQNFKSFSAGILTALRNRIGDVALLIRIAWILNYGRWNYLFYVFFIDDNYLFIISLFIILAAFTKRAQIPFSAWLPAAIAAPTPVSSLVHSSTLVTAGVYLIIRFSYCFCDKVLILGLLLSCLTIFIAGLGANFEFDLKKIIALSTLSQLGLIIRILFRGGEYLAFFHLLSHALFKALLFICAGSFIHRFINFQDIRFIGSALNFIPLTSCFFIICNFSLCGLPFLSGFYSKDLILEFYSIKFINMFSYILFFVSTGLTVSYTVRLIYYLFFGYLNFSPLFLISEGGNFILFGILGLIFPVIVAGSVLSWLIFSTPYYICLPLYIKFITLFVIFSGLLIGVEVSRFSLNYHSKSLNFINFSWFSSLIWGLPLISSLGIRIFPLTLGRLFISSFDQGWLEHLGAQGFIINILKLTRSLHLIFSNQLKLFLIMLIFWVSFLILFYLNSLKRV